MIHVEHALEGFYRTEILRPDGSVRFDSGLNHNMILDHGLNQMGYSTGSFANSCFVGTGTTPPQPTNNALQAQVMSAGTSQKTTTFGKELGEAKPYAWLQSVWTFTAATANVTLGEMGTGGNGTELVTRSLLKDTDGNPTTITLLTGEVLRVTHVLRNYFDLADNTGSFVVGGVTYNYSARGILFRDSSYWQLKGGWAYPDAIRACEVPADSVWTSTGTLDQKLSKAATKSESFYPNSTPKPPNPSPGVTRWVSVFGVNQANYTLGVRYFEVIHSQSNYRDGATYGILLDKALMKTDKMSMTVTLDITYVRYTP
ncbi:hypothetical protein [Stenotrophomonas phage TS-10]|uniref:Uncharacterized protein n=1 Tax=Stenotrophomonas phage TS-10 TaxID=2886106 RepID=A0AAE9C3S2_9CAUD|nr:hypothetical protein [Stenotrophomonas phage TS-10]